MLQEKVIHLSESLEYQKKVFNEEK